MNICNELPVEWNCLYSSDKPTEDLLEDVYERLPGKFQVRFNDITFTVYLIDTIFDETCVHQNSLIKK